MGIGKWLARLPIFPLLIAVSFFVGWFIPAYYDWTGADQSRPSPLVLPTAIGLMVGAAAVWAVLPWLPIATGPRDADPPLRLRFKIRTMLLATAAAAVAIALLMKFPTVVSGGLCAIAYCWVLRFCILHHQYRVQTAALLSCMCLPYVWLVAWDELDLLLPTILWMASGLPAFFPSLMIGRLFGQNMHDASWLTFLLTAAELVIGVWIIRIGPKYAIAYFVLVMLLSIVGSFGLNAMVRV